jgi:hypothetical protein
MIGELMMMIGGGEQIGWLQDDGTTTEITGRSPHAQDA